MLAYQSPAAAPLPLPTVDLPAMMLLPSDIDPPDCGLVYAGFLVLSEVALQVSAAIADPATEAEVADRLNWLGWRGRHVGTWRQAGLALDGPSDSAVVVLTEIDEFESADAATSAFALFDPTGGPSGYRRVSGSATVGDQSVVVVFEPKTPSVLGPFTSLAITLCRGRMLGTVTVNDHTGRAVTPDLLDRLSTNWLRRIDAALAGEGAGLGLRALRLVQPNSLPLLGDDRYLRFGGEQPPLAGLGRWDNRSDLKVFGAAPDVYRAALPAENGGPVLGLVICLLGFANDRDGSAWIAAIGRARQLPELTRVMAPVADVAPIGDQTLGFVYEPAPLDPFIPALGGVVVRVGREAVVTLIGPRVGAAPPFGTPGVPASSLAAAESIAADQIACLVSGRPALLRLSDASSATGYDG